MVEGKNQSSHCDTPPKITPLPKNEATISSSTRCLHQTSSLSLHYDESSSIWTYRGKTTFYVISDKDDMSFNFRGGGVVDKVEAWCFQPTTPGLISSDENKNEENSEAKKKLDNKNNHEEKNSHCPPPPTKRQKVVASAASTSHSSSLEKISVLHYHHDPLEKILRRPPRILKKNGGCDKFEADSHCLRGGEGLTASLRAASIASSLGELRVSIVRRPSCSNNSGGGTTTLDVSSQSVCSITSRNAMFEKARECWKDDLLTEPTTATNDECDFNEERLLKRIEHISNEMSSNEDVISSSFKVTIMFHFPTNTSQSGSSTGGLHFHHSHPVVYTTTGTLGSPYDGPRTWLPCLDSASIHHRSSHILIITATTTPPPTSSSPQVSSSSSSYPLNLLIYGSGETYGHTTISSSHTTWTSLICHPVPARSLCFAVGPFMAIPDPEYRSSSRSGIRQVVLCPMRLRRRRRRRRNYHQVTTNIPICSDDDDNINIAAAVAVAQQQQPHPHAKTITACTSGVPLRALTLMKEVLNLSSFPTESYTQIWIPDAVDGGGLSTGTLAQCLAKNSWLGGATLDARLLYPSGKKLPFFHGGGKTLRDAQAACAIEGWVRSAVPLCGEDDVGEGYLHTLFVSSIFSFWERSYGGSGEGGSRLSHFNDGELRANSGLSSSFMEFLPLENVEEEEMGNQLEEQNKDELWRGQANGTESRTGKLDDWTVRMVSVGDIVEYVERGSQLGEKGVPLPSPGWMGSALSLSFLSSNGCSSERVGCGGLDLLHPLGGLPYRHFKSAILARICEGRAGVKNFVRTMRCCFYASLLSGKGRTSLDEEAPSGPATTTEPSSSTVSHAPKPPFLTCLEEMLLKGGLSQNIFTRSLRLLAGPINAPHLAGSLYDVSRDVTDSKNRHFTDPEGFPHSYIRGASGLYLRVGAHVQPASAEAGGGAVNAAAAVRGIHLHVYVEQVVPEGGMAFGGPIVLRVVENEGQCREFERVFKTDGGRCEWGPIFLHAKDVTSQKQQTAASGAIEGNNQESKGGGKDGSGQSGAGAKRGGGGVLGSHGVFNTEILHGGGYQALELVRLTNRTPLLWIRVDPHHLYHGKIAIFQPDACLGEQLFHDGDAAGQIEAIRSLAERPLRIQGSVKITSVYDVPVNEMPVRVLADCLRGSAALHSSLPHTPVVRAQSALAIAQWQNNKAPTSKDAVGLEAWLGLNLLLQYFKERYYVNELILPCKFTRMTSKKSAIQSSADKKDTTAASNSAGSQSNYCYLDTLDPSEQEDILKKRPSEVQFEEDEEYRVRSAVITAIASIRAKDGQTPNLVLRFLEAMLLSGDGAALPEDYRSRMDAEETSDRPSLSLYDLPYESCHLVADVLLSLCYVNCRPDTTTAAGGHPHAMQSHPIIRIMGLCHRWLDWELYKEVERMERDKGDQTGIGGGCYPHIGAAAITALCSLAILRQSTSPEDLTNNESTNHSPHPDANDDEDDEYQKQEGQRPTTSTETSSMQTPNSTSAAKQRPKRKADEAASAPFYKAIFDHIPARADAVRAAAAQAVACVCCASDRFEMSGGGGASSGTGSAENDEPVGLLLTLEFLLERIIRKTTSIHLRRTLSSIMMDSCTGKVCSMQRVAALSSLDPVAGITRFFHGPLGATYGGDNGSALLTTVSEFTFPAANAVNDGARQGLRLLQRSGRDATYSERTTVKVAQFATRLWRCINGEDNIGGVCATDGMLRVSLLSLWQWIWPKTCIAVLRVHSWKSLEGTPRYVELGCEEVMKITKEEKDASMNEEMALEKMKKVINVELDRQRWRGEMAEKAFEYWKKDGKKDLTGAADQGLGHPLPVVEKDNAWKLGGWVASAAQQRRKKALDGGTAVTKVRLTVKNSGMGEE